MSTVKTSDEADDDTSPTVAVSEVLTPGGGESSGPDNWAEGGKPTKKDNSLLPGIGKKIAEKSGGLFSPDDWMCKSCGNINWARRSNCNMCSTPKFQKAEARTGAGGGYNERENVEYIERDESDDEYDEFGRKKKKFRGPAEELENEQEQLQQQQKPKAAVLLTNDEINDERLTTTSATVHVKNNGQQHPKEDNDDNALAEVMVK